jgi:hypothetical protein
MARWEQMRAASVHLSSGVWAGLISGALIGGLGGRLAMFLLRVTSDPSLRGLETDDGFEIGSFTGSTIFLVALCVAGGVLGGLFYLAVRSWAPRRYRAVAMATFVGLAGGATIIKPDGIDFTLVEPHALSIALFIALPALYGAVVSILTERFLDKKEGRVGSWGPIALVPLLGLAVLGPFAAIVVAIALVGWMLNLKFPILDVWSSRPVSVIGRTALIAITCATSATLIADIWTIL